MEQIFLAKKNCLKSATTSSRSIRAPILWPCTSLTGRRISMRYPRGQTNIPTCRWSLALARRNLGGSRDARANSSWNSRIASGLARIANRYANYFKWLDTADEYFEYWGYPGQADGFWKRFTTKMPSGFWRSSRVLPRLGTENEFSKV